LDDLSVHTGTVVVVGAFTVVDGETIRGRLVLELVDEVVASSVVVEAAIDVTVIDDEEEPQAVTPSIMTRTNGR
jgi:hypothetical protein